MRGLNYIQASIDKFKKDALSKILYDISKILLTALIVLILSLFIPEGFKFKEFLVSKLEVRWYQVILFTLVIIISTLSFIAVLFKRKYSRLMELHLTDELTGLRNHKALNDYLNQRIKDLNSSNDNMAYILIDVDDFKSINTEHGYNIADKLLKKLGEVLANDKRLTDMTFRRFHKGDEFVIIANETSLHGAVLAAERKRKLIENTTFTVDGKNYNLTVCCGVTEFKKKSDDVESIGERANVALLKSKGRKGKNCTNSAV